VNQTRSEILDASCSNRYEHRVYTGLTRLTSLITFTDTTLFTHTTMRIMDTTATAACEETLLLDKIKADDHSTTAGASSLQATALIDPTRYLSLESARRVQSPLIALNDYMERDGLISLGGGTSRSGNFDRDLSTIQDEADYLSMQAYLTPASSP
jgi:hypothetical protein